MNWKRPVNRLAWPTEAPAVDVAFHGAYARRPCGDLCSETYIGESLVMHPHDVGQLDKVVETLQAPTITHPDSPRRDQWSSLGAWIDIRAYGLKDCASSSSKPGATLVCAWTNPRAATCHCFITLFTPSCSHLAPLPSTYLNVFRRLRAPTTTHEVDEEQKLPVDDLVCPNLSRLLHIGHRIDVSPQLNPSHNL